MAITSFKEFSKGKPTTVIQSADTSKVTGKSEGFLSKLGVKPLSFKPESLIKGGPIVDVSAPAKPGEFSETMAEAGAKTAANVPSSAFNFAKGLTDFFNPIVIGGQVLEAGKEVADVAREAKEQGKTAGETIGGIAKELPGAAAEVAKGFVPEFLRHLASGDTDAARVAIENDPVGSFGPIFLALKGGAEKAGKGAEFEAGVRKLTSPVTEGVPKSAEFVGDTAKKVGGAVVDTSKGLAKGVKTKIMGEPAKVGSIDEVVKQAEKELAPSEMLNVTEKVTGKPSLLEKWSGISPDIKNRIAGKAPQLKEYFDVAKARNNFDTLPTPLEHGAKKVDLAQTKLNELLNDTGGEIGSFRKKVSTYKASPDALNAVEATLGSQLEKLNLEVMDGVIRKAPGKITRTNSANEISVLNDLYKDWQTVKQSPSLENLIDFRNRLDSKINFEKSSREVSSSLDPFSRVVRKKIADVAAEIVGKSEAANLTKYSEFIDAYNTLKSFTDRKAGAEFLLKQALSERGAAPREVMQTIKELTGIDLMDDATMASIATDLLGNSRQQGLFRQEITKAGLDAASLISGNPTGAINLMLERGKKLFLDEEKQFMKAAENK